MKKQDFIQKLADTLKVDAKILATELEKDDNIELELPKTNIFTDDELSTLKENIKKEGYDDGVTVGFDKSAKKLKELTGVEVEGKDLEKIAEAITKKANADAKIEPNTKIEELNTSLSKLQQTVTDLTTEKQTVEDNFKNYKQKQGILSEIPTNSLGLSNETVYNEMLSNGYDFSGDEVKLKGEVLKDNLQNPIKRQDVFKQFMTEKNWLKVDKTGRGGGDEGGSGSTPVNYEQFLEQCKAKGISPQGEQGQARAKELAAENPEFYN